MKESPQTESVILCEGYHDRAFWAGWLEHLGCSRPPDVGEKPGSGRVFDPWGREVNGGQYGYRSKTHKFIRIVPCRGDRKRVLREADRRLKEERQRVEQRAAESQLARLILNVDPDVTADGTSVRTGFRFEDLQQRLRKHDSDLVEDRPGDLALFRGAVLISLIRWEATDQVADGLPNQQTLERLVCAALTAAYPDRGPAVKRWLDSRPDGPVAGPKEFGWSYMAGWYAEFGCEGFYRNLWLDGRVVTELKSRLAECRAWRVAEALAD